MDLGWRADGIERALAAGGVPLERYRRPGFEAGHGVRRSDAREGGAGVPVDSVWPADPDPDPDEYARCRSRS